LATQVEDAEEEEREEEEREEEEETSEKMETVTLDRKHAIMEKEVELEGRWGGARLGRTSREEELTDMFINMEA